MKTGYLMAGGLVTFAVVVVVLSNRGNADHNLSTASATTQRSQTHFSAQVLPSPATHPVFKALPKLDQSRPADLSMQWAREHGDSRTPPLRRMAETDQPPTAEQLADPKAYADYEQQQKLRTYANFVHAADAQIPQLEQQIQQAKTMDISPDKLAVGEEKLRRIQQMRDQLQATYPQLNGMATNEAAPQNTATASGQ